MTSNPVFSTAVWPSRRASPSLGRDGESPAARDQANPVALSAKERSDRIYDEFVAPNKPKRYRLSRAGRALDARQPSTSEAEARAGANPMHRAAAPTPLTPVVEIPAAVVQPPNGAGLLSSRLRHGARAPRRRRAAARLGELGTAPPDLESPPLSTEPPPLLPHAAASVPLPRAATHYTTDQLPLRGVRPSSHAGFRY